MIDPNLRDRRSRKWKRWERAVPMELWQMDVVGGFPLADGTSAKVLTGTDDHSRMCVCARLMARERTRAVCDGLRAALATYGVPGQILTDNGKVFTGRFNHPPVEVLFDAICREHGIEHLLTQPRSPTTTGKIDRFHRTVRTEFLWGRAPFTNLKAAERASLGRALRRFELRCPRRRRVVAVLRRRRLGQDCRAHQQRRVRPPASASHGPGMPPAHKATVYPTDMVDDVMGVGDRPWVGTSMPGEDQSCHEACSPHSAFAWPAQRPLRGSAPSWGMDVQGAQPIDG
jgi:hypothetical protein